VGRFFRNSHEALILNILQDEAIDAADLKRLREMLERGNVRGEERGEGE
jgi:predicted transcriptional regulator